MKKWFWRFVTFCMIANLSFLTWAIIHTESHYKISYYAYDDTLTFNTAEEYGNFMLQLNQLHIPLDTVTLKTSQPPIEIAIRFDTRSTKSSAKPIDSLDYINHKPVKDIQGWDVFMSAISMFLFLILAMLLLDHHAQETKTQKTMCLEVT